MTLIVVNYHYVRPRFEHPFPGIHGMTPGAIEQQLRLLGSSAEFVSLADVRVAVRGGRPLPARALLVTFDDGLREQMDHAVPLLDRLGIPAAFFVNTHPVAEQAVSPVHQIHLLRAQTAPAELRALLHAETRRAGIAVELEDRPEATASYPWDEPASAQLKYFLNHTLPPDARDALIEPCFRARFGDDAEISRGLYMDVAQLRDLAARDWLGTHGDRHLPLGRVSAEAIREDLRTSITQLTEWTGKRPYALSYPFGTFETVNPAAQLGAASERLEIAFTAERAANVDLVTPLHLARYDANDLPGGRQPCLPAEGWFEEAAPARWYR